MNAIKLLKHQHKKTKTALRKAAAGELSPKEAHAAADELVAHMVIEEFIFYPRVRSLLKDLVNESFEEHTVARFEIARCLSARGEQQVKARFTVLKELIEHHVEEEEQEMFIKVQKVVTPEELEQLGQRMETMFEKAVTMGIERLVTGATHKLHGVNVDSNGKKALRGKATTGAHR